MDLHCDDPIGMPDEAPGWCDRCHNTGSLDCLCGGDLCVCENYGEMPCPDCGE